MGGSERDSDGRDRGGSEAGEEHESEQSGSLNDTMREYKLNADTFTGSVTIHRGPREGHKRKRRTGTQDTDKRTVNAGTDAVYCRGLPLANIHHLVPTGDRPSA